MPRPIYLSICELQVENPSKKARKSAFRFNAAADIALLKEVLVVEPYAAPHGETSKRWNSIVSSSGSKFTSETARKRLAHLISQFKANNAQQIRR